MVSRRVFARFVVVNVLNTAVYYGLYLLFLLAMPYVMANIVALVLAIVLAYVANARYAFHVSMTSRSLVVFVASNLTTTVLRTLVLWLLVEFAGLGQQIAPVVATALTLPVAFVLTKMAMAGRGAPAPSVREAEAALA